jgi:formate/nitrite transporter FocA (FNT family)
VSVLSRLPWATVDHRRAALEIEQPDRFWCVMTANGDDEDQRRVRASAGDIYERVKQDATEELERPAAALAFSALFAGATVGFGAVASAAVSATLVGHQGSQLLAAVFFPIGFIVVIIGRAQLFTENTLYPVTLVLDERRHLFATARLWAIVLGANLVGAVLFAVLATKSGALDPDVIAKLAQDGHRAMSGSWPSVFWSAVLGGWMIALVAWLIQSTEAVSGQVALIWALAFLVALLRLDHCVSTTVQAICALIKGQAHLGRTLVWLAVVIAGNVAGGVLIVAVLNYGQVRAGENQAPSAR